MDYALIENGVVTNIIWLSPANANEFPDAVPMHDLPVGIGDTFTEGVFYRDGERILSESERAIAMLEAAETAYYEGVNEA